MPPRCRTKTTSCSVCESRRRTPAATTLPSSRPVRCLCDRLQIVGIVVLAVDEMISLARPEMYSSPLSKSPRSPVRSQPSA